MSPPRRGKPGRAWVFGYTMTSVFSGKVREKPSRPNGSEIRISAGPSS